MHPRPRAVLAALIVVFIAALLLGRAAAPFDGEGIERGIEEREVETVPALRLPDAD